MRASMEARFLYHTVITHSMLKTVSDYCSRITRARHVSMQRGYQGTLASLVVL